MTRAEVAWLAGLVEGEGTFTFSHKAALSIAMTDSDIIDRLPRLTNVGNVYPYRSRAKEYYKPVTVWTVSRQRHLYPLVKVIRPWLGERRGAAADQVLQWLESRQ